MAVKQYALCLHNQFGGTIDGSDLVPGLIYACVAIERGALRIVDESGEDFLYPASAFRLLSEEESAVLGQSLARDVA